MPQTLRDLATQDLEYTFKEYGEPFDDQDVMRWMRNLIAASQVPDDILEAMPEVSRHNFPQDSPQEYECGCVAIARITDRDHRRKEEPFEMCLAIPCRGTHCRLAHLRTKGS